MCALFGRVFGRLRFRTSLPFYTVASVGILMLFFVRSVPVTAVCCLVCGGCFGSLFSYNYVAGSLIVPPEQIDRASGIVTAAYGLAVFVSTYFATFLMDLVGTGLVSDTLVILFGLCAVAGFVEALRVRKA